MRTPTTAVPATDAARPPRHRAHTALRRAAALSAAAGITVASTVFLAPVSQAAGGATTPGQHTRAGAAVSALTAGGSGTAATIPDDFAARFGYRPGLVDGLLANPKGDCSSPVPLPAEFDTACKAHDLGYDLLRYAHEHGEPLGAWARQALDTTLATRMHAACETRPELVARARCHAMATIANTAVDLNSRRQDYGAPVVETLFGAKLSGSDTTLANPVFAIAGAGLLGLSAIAAALVGARRARRTLAAATPAQRTPMLEFVPAERTGAEQVQR